MWGTSTSRPADGRAPRLAAHASGKLGPGRELPGDDRPGRGAEREPGPVPGGRRGPAVPGGARVLTKPRPFRFAATVPTQLQPVQQWRDSLRQIEDLGFSSVAMADHFTDGYQVEPIVLLTAAAMCSPRLRLLTAVLGNDYRHPVLTHRMVAELDVLSEGRVELGLGAGWMTSDYDAAGIAYDPPGERVSRFEEAVAVLEGLFGPGPFSWDGKHYSIRDLD